MKHIGAQKVFAHLDRLAEWQRGGTPAPVTVEIDLTNVCSLGCQSCFTQKAKVETMARGRVSIADVVPGEIVLGYDEATRRAAWVATLAVSERPFAGTIYTIHVGQTAIEATGEHPFLTERGWVAASNLTVGDRLVGLSETLRLRLRPESVDGRLDDSSRPSPSRDTRQNLCGQAGEQSHEAPGDCGKGSRGEQRQASSGCVGVAPASVRRRTLDAASDERGVAPESVRADEARQSHETTGGGSEGERYLSGQWRIRTTRRGVTPVLGHTPGVQGSRCAADEDAQSDVRQRYQGTQPEQDAVAPECVEVGAVVRPVLRAAHGSGLVYGHGTVLGEGAQSRLQGPRPETDHRSYGRLQQNAGRTDAGRLRDSNDSALRGARVLLSRGDAAAAHAPSNGGDAGGSQALRGSVSGDRLEPNLVLASIDRIDRDTRVATVYNLETSHGTYAADGMVVHNCHFAHTHVAGPWARKAEKPKDYGDTGRFAEQGWLIPAVADMHAAGVQAIVWSGGGEPTLHPEFDLFVQWAHRCGLQQGMYTLGGHLTEARAAFVKQHFTWAVVSLDCPDAETYAREKGVPPSRFADACAGIRRLAGGAATVGVSFLLHAGNWTRTAEMLALARSLGATYATFRPTIETDHADLSVITGDRSWVTAALPTLWELHAEADVEVDPDRFEEYRDWTGRDYQTCHGIRLVTQVTPDGRVWVCPNRRGLAGSELGDLTRDTFADLWARHPGQWTDFSGCRAMCRLHLVNRQLAPVFEKRQHEAFV